MSKIDRKAVYESLGGHCAYCGETIEYKDMQVDHIIPKQFFEWHLKNEFKIPPFLKHLKLYDVDHSDNLLPTCRVCNKWKSAHDLELFRSEIFAQIERLNKRSSNYRMAKKYGLVQETPNPIIFYFEKHNTKYIKDE